jgi:ATP-dependent Clp protease adapter protein ClpS
MEVQQVIEINDNTFARQFETTLDGALITVEYSFQERKIFLTRINLPDDFNNEEYVDELIKTILGIAEERKLKVVPIYPRITKFFRKNKSFKDLLPPGIRI